MAHTPEIYADFIDLAALRTEADAVASGIEISAFPGMYLAEQLAINPAKLAGKVVIDAPSGCSDMVWWLHEHGANAIGVDIGYDEPETLYQGINTYIEKRLSANPRNADGMEAIVQGPFRRFREDFAEHRERYVTGDILALPADDESVDLVINYQCVTTADAVFPNFTTAAVLEGLRVLNRNGALRVGPFTKGRSPQTNARRAKIEDFIRSAAATAKQVGINTKVTKIQQGPFANLSITRLK